MLGNDHGLIHAAKVCLFVALLGRKLKLSEKELLTLMVSAVFHDIGRKNNSDDATHGERSYSKMLEHRYSGPGELEEIMRLHSRADKKPMSRLAMIFKDADALDRVRTNDLDTKYLRFEESKLLVETAKEVNACLLKVIG